MIARRLHRGFVRAGRVHAPGDKAGGIRSERDPSRRHPGARTDRPRGVAHGGMAARQSGWPARQRQAFLWRFSQAGLIGIGFERVWPCARRARNDTGIVRDGVSRRRPPRSCVETGTHACVRAALTSVSVPGRCPPRHRMPDAAARSSQPARSWPDFSSRRCAWIEPSTFTTKASFCTTPKESWTEISRIAISIRTTVRASPTSWRCCSGCSARRCWSNGSGTPAYEPASSR